MSKFFNETLKNRNPVLPQEALDLEGLKEIGAMEDAADVGVATPLSVEAPAAVFANGSLDFDAPVADPVRRIEMPRSSLLATQFEGSDSLQAAEESYRALRTRLLRLRSGRELRSVVITSSSASEGKTLTSFNLALCCAQLEDMRILLVDGDIRTGGLSRRLGAEALPGLSDVLSFEDRTPESVIVETDQVNLHFCSAGSTTQSPPELYASRRWHDFMDWCHDTYQLVVIDSPPIMSLADVELMSAACDGAVLVVRARQTNRDLLQKAAMQLDPKKFVGVVYNVSEGTHQKYYYASGKKR